MAIERHFLGWDTPVTDRAVDFLLPGRLAGPPDLARDLVIVPTRQAGRRLREALALRCAAAGTALLSARVETPGVFIRGEEDGGVASPLQVALSWAAVLTAAGPDEFPGLFPTPVADRNFAWGLRTGEMLQSLRESLADGGLRIADVVASLGPALEERDRWEDLAELEQRLLRDLADKKKQDPCCRKISGAGQPELPDGIERIVVAAVPDPSALLLRALEHLADRLDIRILIHAPAERASDFDAYGRPVIEAWKNAVIDIPRPEESIRLAATPEDQAQQVLHLMADPAASWGPADLAVGVPDRSVVPPLAAALEARGLIPFDPAGGSPEAHPVYRLLRTLQALASGADYASIAEALRHPDMLAFLRDRHALAPSAVLAELDPFQNRHLPASLDDMMAHLDPAAWPALTPAMRQLQAFRERLAQGPVSESVREMLRAIYEKRELRHGIPEDEEFMAVASLVDEGLRDLGEALSADVPVSNDQALEVLLRRLSSQSYTAEREDSKVDLEGWLELPWNNAPLLIVTGLNDGIVPDSRMGDVFLPDPLRVALGLRSDQSRLARDIYLLTSLVESRRARGRVVLVIGKTARGGEPLKPSRLLFRCRREELAARAERLFGPAAPSRAAVPVTISFPLHPCQAVAPRALRTLPVTAFRAYLNCPFRFYLGHVLRMEEQNDEKAELDAMDFGSLVHDALQGLAAFGDPVAARDEQALHDMLCARAQAWVRERFGRNPPLQVRIQLDAARQRLAAVSRCQQQLVAAGWKTVATEVRCEMEWEGMTVRGMIDRVDRHAQNGRIRIIDYKTSDTAIAPGRAHLARPVEETPEFAAVELDGKTMRWIDLQLPLYRRLLSTAMELPPEVELGYFNLPKAVGETGLSLWEAYSDAIQASAETCARGVIRAIREQRFWPPAPRVLYDPFERILSGDATTGVAAVDAPATPCNQPME